MAKEDDPEGERVTDTTTKSDEELYRFIVDNMVEGVLIINRDLEILYANSMAATIAGADSPEEMIGRKSLDFVHPESQEDVIESHELVMQGKKRRVTEYKLLNERWIETKPVKINYRGQPANLLTFVDITERKHAEDALRASEEQFRSIYEDSPIGIEIYNSGGFLLHVNNACLDIFGITDTAEVKGFSLFDDPNIPYKDKEQLRTGKIVRYEVPFDFEEVKKRNLYKTTKAGIAYISVIITPLGVYGKDHPSGYLVQVQDFTERKKTEEQIKAALKEKEVLLKEIHHRVKNNLQLVSSLLNLQARHIKDKEALELFKDSQNRLGSIALVHEKLYQSDDLAGIDFTEYVQSLTGHLFFMCGDSSSAVRLHNDIKEVLLDVTTAIPCGLIINELVSNALTYAFPDGRDGEITIVMHLLNENEVERIVRDNGIGFPEDLDFRNTESLGMQIVTSLVGQLEGTIELNRASGTAFRIVFPNQI